MKAKQWTVEQRGERHGVFDTAGEALDYAARTLNLHYPAEVMITVPDTGGEAIEGYWVYDEPDNEGNNHPGAIVRLLWAKEATP